MSTSLVRVDAPLQQQPQEVRPVDWGNPLTHGLVFLAVPCGFAWWDCISRQIASPNANATTPFRARQTVDGNRASAISLVGSGVGGGTSAAFFANRTGLDEITGAHSLFVEGSPEINAATTVMVESSESSAGNGIGFRWDDAAVVVNSFMYWANNSNRTSSAANSIGANSEQSTHRVMFTNDGANTRFYAKRVLNNSPATTVLPTGHANRRTKISGNIFGSAVNSASIIAAWNRVLTLDEYQQLYDNPWILLQPRRIVVVAYLAGGGGTTHNVSISESASATDAITSAAGLAAALSEAVSAADSIAASAVLDALISETASASDAMSAGLLLVGLLSEAATASDEVSAVLARVGALTESASGSDALTAVATLTAALSEAATAADQLAATGALVATVAESASAADSVNWGGISYSVSISEATSASDAVAAAHAMVAALAEAAGAADAITSIMVATATVAELAAAVDAVVAGLQLPATFAEAATATDLVSGTSQQVHEVSLLEAAAAVDAWTGTLPARVLAALRAIDGVRRTNDTRRGARLALGRAPRNNGSTR